MPMVDQISKQAEETAKKSAEAQKAYDDAAAKMTDARVFDRVRAFHSRAHTSPEALSAMQADYDRLKADADKEREQDQKNREQLAKEREEAKAKASPTATATANTGLAQPAPPPGGPPRTA